MRRKKAGSGPGALAAAQAASTSIAGVRTPTFADTAMLGGPEAGLSYARVQADIADQLLRIGETADVTDRRDQAGSNNQVDAGDREQLLHCRITDGRLRDLSPENRQILAQPIEFAQVSFDRGALVIGDDLSCQPDPSQSPEQFGMRAWRDQIGMQDRVHFVLDPRAVPDNLGCAAPPIAGAVQYRLGQPGLRQEIPRPQRRQHAGIDLVLT